MKAILETSERRLMQEEPKEPEEPGDNWDEEENWE
jgi:hypothetical protein